MSIPHDMYIDGRWTAASDGSRSDIMNPATEGIDYYTVTKFVNMRL